MNCFGTVIYSTNMSVDQKQLMPAANKRVREVIDERAGGNVLKFVSLINEGKIESQISQQKLNRLFNLDPRTGKWPTVPHDIFEAILIRFPEVDAAWLITGQKKSSTEKVPDPLLTLLTQEIQTMQSSLNRLATASAGILGSTPMVNPPVQDLGLGKNRGNKSLQKKNDTKGNVSKKGN
jgi:hypothetical protein